LSEEEIISYHRQKNINRVFPLVVLVILVASIWLSVTRSGMWETKWACYMLIPLGIYVLAAVFGVISKRSIDYKPGKWTEEKTWVTPETYEELAAKNKQAYGRFYSSGGAVPGCFCSGMFLAFLSIAIFVFTLYSAPILNETADSILFVVVLDVLTSSIGFYWGFKIPKIDATAFFVPPVERDELRFLNALRNESQLRAGVNVTIGRRSGMKTIMAAEPKIYVEGLPETVSLSLKVSHSGFAYPYLVGTIYKGPKVKKGSEEHRIDASYPAIVETSMDGIVSVYVARFDIPERTSSVPNISFGDFRKLAMLIVGILKRDASD
jgi:hypothetical protein